MPLHRRRFCIAASVGAPLLSHRAWSQGTRGWPHKPIHFVTPYPPAGLSDQITRFAAERISKALGQSIIVDNKPGAGATLGTEYAARAAPDGYTFLVAPTAAVAIAPWLRQVNFSAQDFIPVAKLACGYGLITGRKNEAFDDYRKFVAAAKAAPGKYTFASNGVGTIVHLTGVLLHKQAGIDVLHVPYKGSMESMMDLLGGRIDIMYDPVTLPRVKSGDLVGLATSSAERHPEIPDVPTLAQLGFNLDTRSWFGIFAPKGTPGEIVARMAEEAGKALRAPDVRQQLLMASMYPDFEGPTAFATRVREDSAFFKALILREGIKAD
ncbi:tripartite tricarboxylate transporter substrate binding protein [Verminephrobacter eiseniae]|uniref:tripartite tricarboxylate transporter substrate binding protein n=1 Tax=Verminephrobacter eiseniae TaxID=364317 RepID=UPI002237F965|nr:tripartite tricarboxylate transporter substrate binding protein [Verminephrobacter eiseniae]MCW5237797.1 tripartite tricarboxylate transporter substrate binding protein [Verminephrobacter eiseniae]